MKINVTGNKQKAKQKPASTNPLQTMLAKANAKNEKGEKGKTQQKSLAQMLAKNKNDKKEQNEISQNSTPIPAVQPQKYNLLVDPPESLPTATVDKFCEIMQMILDKMETDEIHAAMEKCYNFAKAHPELKAIIQPEDIAIFVRGARKASGKVLYAKSSTRKKSSARKETQKQIANELDDVFAALELK